MEYYLDIKMMPDEEVPLYFIRNKVFTKLHKALFDHKQHSIGVSFPNHQIKTKKDKAKLGDIVRLHGDKHSLQGLQDANWLGGLIGYCDVSEILAVPNKIKGYRTVSRIQGWMSLTKLAKRIDYQKKTGVLTTTKAIKAYEKQYKEKMITQNDDHAYIDLISSKGHRYQRFITFGELLDNVVKGDFDQFGLSKVATIPWF